MELEIRSDVPIPTTKKSGPTSKYEALLEMKRGDSVTLPTQSDANAAQMLLSRHDMGATMRKQKDGTYMLWRVF
jgi:hypothetical protein